MKNPKQFFLLLGLASFLLVIGPEKGFAVEHANIFVYHRFGDARFPSTNIALDDFRRHLEILRIGGYQVITLGELVTLLEQKRTLPDRCVVLTVDDAYRSFLEGAWPLLDEFGFRATLFVNTDTVGDYDYLDWGDLRQLQTAGIEIGNHSASHDYLIDRLPGEQEQAWSERVIEDIRRARKAFVDNLDNDPDLFAYPYGEYTPELVRLIRRIGFRAAVGQQSGVVAPGDDLFTLARFPMGGGYSAPDEFLGKIDMRPLSVEVIVPGSTLVGDVNPPTLQLRINMDGLDVDSLRCFIPGQGTVEVKPVAGEEWLFEVRANAPLQGRRSKYTFTASDPVGREWYWYSHPWILPRP